MYNVRVADHHTYFVGKGEWGWAAWAHNEYFYRAMSEKEYSDVIASQKLSRRDSGSSELGVTQDADYAASLAGRRFGERKYPHVVKIQVADGTQVQLVNAGGKHPSIPENLFPGRPEWTVGMPIMLKLERLGVVSYLITSDDGLQLFNGNIISITTIK